MKIKILTYNIHKGFNWNNKDYCLNAIKNIIIESKAELIFLQEVTGKNEFINSQGLIDNQFEFLADNLFPYYAYAQNAIYDHGHHGNMIISKYPIESFDNFDLSTNTLEKRGLLTCNIKIPASEAEDEKKILVGCLHLNLLHSSRKKQYKKIIDFIKKHECNDQYILAGDFNDWNKKSFKSFEDILSIKEVHFSANGYYAKTFPSNLPLLSLDRIYVKNINIISSRVIKGDKNLSDHLPLFCEVEIK